MSFANKLAEGKIGESWIAQWLQSRGYNVLPVYEIEIGHGKGPAIYSAQFDSAALGFSQFIAPDMIAFKRGKVRWIEAKHKSAFTWHRITSRFVTGIDCKHYEDYLKVAEIMSWELWLMFLHKGLQAKDSPPSPSGLYGRNILELRDLENHRSGNWGRSGMVYWAEQSLIKLSDYHE